MKKIVVTYFEYYMKNEYEEKLLLERLSIIYEIL